MSGVILSAMIASTIEMQCLARNIYFEARNQTDTGMVAVAHVTINRALSNRYPDTLCGVVHQAKRRSNGTIIKNKCQFSWYCDGLSDRPKNLTAWAKAVEVAYKSILVYHNEKFDVTDGATHYHTTNVSPSWAPKLERLITIDDHIFYKE